MEASNAFGTAQAAPGETPVYEPGEQTTPTAPVTPDNAEALAAGDAGQQAAPGGEEAAPADPVLEAIAGLRGEIEGLKAKPEEVDPDLDLLTALNQEPEATEPEPQQAQPQQADQQIGDPEAQRQLEALEQLIDNRASEMIAPLRENQVAREMEGVQKRNPDIMQPQTLSTIAERIGALEARTGAEGLLSDPQMVEQMYKLVKAEAADAGAVAPADAGGAVLETNAGQSQTGGSSFEDDYRSQVFPAQQGTRSIFG
jgi:hypothetical protein